MSNSVYLAVLAKFHAGQLCSAGWTCLWIVVLFWEDESVGGEVFHPWPRWHLCPGTFQISLWMGWRASECAAGGTKVLFEEQCWLWLSPQLHFGCARVNIPNIPLENLPLGTLGNLFRSSGPGSDQVITAEINGLWISMEKCDLFGSGGCSCRGAPWVWGNWGTHCTQCALNSLNAFNSWALRFYLFWGSAAVVAGVNQTAAWSDHERQSVSMAQYSKACSSLLFQQWQILWELCKRSDFSLTLPITRTHHLNVTWLY